MAKITYLLGAGASYYACPILEKQAEMMIILAQEIIQELGFHLNESGYPVNFNFKDEKNASLKPNNEYKILWYIGHFGEMAKEYNTIDTYARKLYLNKDKEVTKYNLLKMCVSVFFDLWENFYFLRKSSNHLTPELSTVLYNKIDNRYKSLFSVLLEKIDDKIMLNNDIKFISWNYDLQLEESFKLFLGSNYLQDYNNLDKLLKFKTEQNDDVINDIFHLNGHRGFFKDKNPNDNKEEEFILNISDDKEKYWNNINWLYDSIIKGKAEFDSYIKYAWEHDFENSFFKKISEVMYQTDVLVIIGYSFPAFNRNIDQFLFNKMHPNKIKKIVYQDPNATKQMIANLFEKPENYLDKIEIKSDSKELNQFYLPNEYFTSQKNGKTEKDLR